MKISIFLYLFFNLLFVQLINSPWDIVTNAIYFLCGLGVLTVGLSHGAADDILHNKGTKKGKTVFILKYLTVIFAYGICWFLIPNIALAFFILLSGYHFGQSQFINYDLDKSLSNKLLYLSWGSLVVFLLLYCQQDYLISFNNQYEMIPKVIFLMIASSGLISLTFLAITFSILFYFCHKKQIRIEEFLMEFAILFIIFISFSLLDPFIGFSLFFIFIHSLQALSHEFHFLKNILRVNSKFEFAKILLPFTVISILGLALTVFVLFLFGLDGYIPFAMLIVVSSITAPHSFVMEEFYAEKNHSKISNYVDTKSI